MEQTHKFETFIKKWEKFNKENKLYNQNINKNLQQEKNKIDTQFKEFINKINEKKLTLQEYTNLVEKNKNQDYLCHFLERTSSKLYGSSKPAGSSKSCGIYRIKNDNEVYAINENSFEKEDLKNLKFETIDKKDIKGLKPEEAEKLFKDTILEELKELLSKDISKIEKEKKYLTARQFLMKIIAMKSHIIDKEDKKDNFLFIYSEDMINAIYDFFIEKDEEDNLSLLEKNQKVTKKLKEIFKPLKENDNYYLIKLSAFIWDTFIANINFPSKNIIFYGAPGTGKTFGVLKTIKNYILKQKGNIEKQLLFTQFHPSYSYEDFIDGIKPTGITSQGQLKLELKNGHFKEFCKRAIETLKEERKKGEKNLIKFFFVADEINRAELSRVFGEVLFSLEEDKRIDFDKNGEIINKDNLITLQNSELDNNPILEINGEKKFGIPINLYFIGTMNDIDRSIDSFDLALRRRFTWIRKDCDYDVINYHFNDDKNIDNYLTACQNLNNYISETLNLGKNYELGHSYFMKIKNINNNQINNLWEEHISPLLKEYLRSESNEKEIEEKLKEAKKRFTLKENK